MINMAQLPTWHELLHPYIMGNQIVHNIEDGIWSDDSQKSFFFSKSCYSFSVALEAYRRAYNKSKITIWVPNYFCSEAISELNNDKICIRFYRQDSDLKALSESLNELIRDGVPDFALLVHYFGLENYDQNLLKFCNQNSIVVVEDAAHVLMPTGNISRYGMFTFYSPHKTIPVPQGSVLVVPNKYDSIKEEIAQIEKEYRNIAIREQEHSWTVKKVVQKLLPQSVNRLMHFGAAVSHECIKDEYSSEITALSNYSYRAMLMYDSTKLRDIAQQRRDNYEKVIEILLKYYACKHIEILDNTSVPLYLYCEFENENEANCAESDFNFYGTFCVTWPTFHSGVGSNEINLWKNSRAFALHSQVPLKKMSSHISEQNRNK